ncbi:hypothetical protein Bca52824_016000 [Brassica carinata]|uniref:Uncharacterized protein n=1 Tax=Brassica carinata TaxID=52824 RepID=A0A8X7W478_BRACI|nr:hypothetical protein Bca52824_016000 [Brassica carinata]
MKDAKVVLFLTEHGETRENEEMISLLRAVIGRAEHLFEVTNSRDDVLRTLMRQCMYLRYVEARLADRVLYADEILKYEFCLNAVRDDDIVFGGLPSTEPF